MEPGNCPKCAGLLTENRTYSAEFFEHVTLETRCVNCGWRPTRQPTADDLRLRRTNVSSHKQKRGGKPKGWTASPEVRKKISEGLKRWYDEGRR